MGSDAPRSGSCLRVDELAWVASAMRAVGERVADAAAPILAQGPLFIALQAAVSCIGCANPHINADQVSHHRAQHNPFRPACGRICLLALKTMKEALAP